MTLEAELRANEERQKKLEEAKLNFLLTVLKQGLDSREDGCLWILRIAAKQKADITEEILPDFIDQSSKEFILSQFTLYQKAADLRDKTSFQRAFYRILSKGEGILENAKRLIFSRYKRENTNPMLEFIGEMNSISIKRRPQLSAMTVGRPDTGTFIPENYSFIDHVPGDRQQSAFQQIDIPEKAFLTEAKSLEGEIESVIEQPKPDEIVIEHLHRSEISENELQSTPGPLGLKEKEASKLESPIIRSPLPGSFAEVQRVSSGRDLSSPHLKREFHIPLSANQRMKMASARSNFSLAESMVVRRKQEEFSRRGVVYIGDANYAFKSHGLFAAGPMPESTQVTQALVSRAARAHTGRHRPPLPDLSRRESGGVHSQSHTEIAKEAASLQVSALGGTESWGKLPEEQAGDEDQQEDVLACHIKFFEGEELINCFESKREMVKLQLTEVQSKGVSHQKYRLLRIPWPNLRRKRLQGFLIFTLKDTLMTKTCYLRV
jgi:hypothetical protein